MSAELQLWVRLVSSVIGMALVLMALFITIGLWLDSKRLYLVFGVLALFVLLLLALLRIIDVPEPSLLPHGFIEDASLVVNALWPLFTLAWLVELLRYRLRVSRLRRKYGLDQPDDEVKG